MSAGFFIVGVLLVWLVANVASWLISRAVIRSRRRRDEPSD
jgi:hypothetical protein